MPYFVRHRGILESLHLHTGVLALLRGAYLRACPRRVCFGVFYRGMHVVAFGRVISGMRAISLREGVELLNQRPIQPVTITACGAFPLPARSKRDEAKE